MCSGLHTVLLFQKRSTCSYRICQELGVLYSVLLCTEPTSGWIILGQNLSSLQERLKTEPFLSHCEIVEIGDQPIIEHIGNFAVYPPSGSTVELEILFDMECDASKRKLMLVLPGHLVVNTEQREELLKQPEFIHRYRAEILPPDLGDNLQLYLNGEFVEINVANFCFDLCETKYPHAHLDEQCKNLLRDIAVAVVYLVQHDDDRMLENYDRHRLLRCSDKDVKNMSRQYLAVFISKERHRGWLFPVHPLTGAREGARPPILGALGDLCQVLFVSPDHEFIPGNCGEVVCIQDKVSEEFYCIGMLVGRIRMLNNIYQATVLFYNLESLMQQYPEVAEDYWVHRREENVMSFRESMHFKCKTDL